MTQNNGKWLGTIISIIILVVFALYKGFGEQKATNKSNAHSSSKLLKIRLILLLRGKTLISLKVWKVSF